jgi:hypothetical protein
MKILNGVSQKAQYTVRMSLNESQFYTQLINGYLA